MDNRPSRKILKSPVAKRRSRLVPKDQKITLEKVLGLTSTSNASLACDPNTGNIAYLAGCVVIIYNPKKNKQGHIFNFSKKTLTAVAYSGDGKHIVTGESGHQPAVRIWDAAEKVQVAEFHGHKFGISCVAFSPNFKYIVSIGTQHDMQINVWNWKSGSKVASNKVSSKVTAVSFSADGSYFVTAGMRHVKFWYLDSSKSKINETVPLSGRNGLLGDHKNNFFCDVATGTGSQDNKTFCITQSGLLCQFNEKRQMDKWVELRTTCANSISAADNLIFVGCAKGVVRVFDANSLYFVVTLPRPHYLGVDIAAAVNPSHINPILDADIKYPDTLALAFDEAHRKVTCIYNDHSIYVWDVHDLKKIGKSWSFLYHSSCVYGVEVYPVIDPSQPSILPNHSFITCSSDDTIRIWNLDPHMAQTDTYKSNIYSHDLLKIMYMDPSLASLCDVDYNPSGAADKTDTNYDDKNGIRSIRVSPDGQHLASGDRQGNVRIIEFKHLQEVKQIEAHESEVLCLEYSNWTHGPKILASSSRDRLIHVYDTEQQYGLLQTLSDHSSSISSVKFTETDGHLKMLTCGADKSILFRNLQQEPDFQFVLGDHLVEKMTLYDMDVEPTHKFAAIACQDRNVRVYNVKTGKKKKEYKGSLGDDGILLKMKLDPSGSYAATSCSDKNICIMDFYTGELLATMYGHSEIATDVRFMNDLKHVISTSGDGCIFIWRLPKEMTSHMQNRLQEIGKAPFLIANGTIKKDLLAQHRDEVDSIPAPLGGEYFSPQKVLNEIYPDYNMPSNTVVPDRNSPDYRFSISQLPSWAKKQVEGGSSSQTTEDPGTNQLARGRWAQRAEGQPLTVKQQDGKSVEFNFATDRRRFTPEAESLSNQLGDVRRETMVLNRTTTAPKNMPIIHDDTLVEDDGDDEDEDFLKPISSSTFVKQDPDKPSLNWDELYSFEAEDMEQPENAEIIYYPPSESDGSDTLASSYQVFDAGPIPDRSIGLKQSFSMNSIPDADSETTDPVSLDDTEDDDSNPSAPSTPMEEFTPKTQHREKFLKDAFENLSFTPTLPTDKFVKGLDTLEEEMNANYSPNSRQSLSARFMSKSIAQRNAHGLQRQENWFDSVQRRKDDMARNLDESRKMLMAMGWKQDSPDTDKEDAFAESPPMLSKSKVAVSSPDKVATKDLSIGETTPTSFTFDQTHTLLESSDPPPSPRTPKSLRRCWSTLDLPKTPIPEEKGLKPATPSTPKMVARRSGNERSTVPIHRVSKHTTDSPQSKIPTPKLYSPKHTRRTLKARVSTSETEAKSSKETSQGNKENPKVTSKQAIQVNRSGKSVPSKREPNTQVNSASSKSEPFTQGNSASNKREPKTQVNTASIKREPNTQVNSASNKRDPNTQVHNTRSGVRSPVTIFNRSRSVETKGPRNISNLPAGKKGNDKVSDRDLMPPPAKPMLAKQKHETRFMRRANQQDRRKTTSSIDLTLEQATDILKGNSGILKKNQKVKRSSSSSPTHDRNKEGFKPISDSNFLTVASEIEQTAAELRLQNSPSFQGEAMPNDLPERDIPPVRDIPKAKPSRPSSLSGHLVNKLADTKTDKNQNEMVKPNVIVNNTANKDSVDQTLNEDETASPSVKERIARLNSNTDVQRQSSPNRDRGRSISPVSPRITTSVRLSLGSNTTSQQMPTAVSTSMSSSIDSAISCSNSESTISTSPRGSRASFQPIPFDPHGEVTHPANTSKVSIPPVSGVMATSGQSLSPPSGLTSSLDSEGLSRQLSPSSYHSNTSQQSVADTGVGSDTDFDLSVSQSSSTTYKGDQKTNKDPVTSLQETMDQISKLSERAIQSYQMIQDCQDERSVKARKQFEEQCSTVTRSLSDCVGPAGSYNNQSVIPVPRDKYNILTELLLKVNSVAADIRHCTNQ